MWQFCGVVMPYRAELNEKGDCSFQDSETQTSVRSLARMSLFIVYISVKHTRLGEMSETCPFNMFSLIS